MAADTGDLVEGAALEAAALLTRAESPYEVEGCSDRTRVWGQVQTGIEEDLDGRLVGGSCDSVAGTIGGAV